MVMDLQGLVVTFAPKYQNSNEQDAMSVVLESYPDVKRCIIEPLFLPQDSLLPQETVSFNTIEPFRLCAVVGDAKPSRECWGISGDDLPDFVGQVVDSVEDFLCDNKIKLMTDERKEAFKYADDETDVSILYGKLYDDIADPVRSAVFFGRTPALILSAALVGMSDALRRGGYAGKIRIEDAVCIGKRIVDTMKQWGIS